MRGPLRTRASPATIPTPRRGTLAADRRECSPGARPTHTTRATSWCSSGPKIAYSLGPRQTGGSIWTGCEISPVCPSHSRASPATTPTPCCGMSGADLRGCHPGAGLTYSNPANLSGMLNVAIERSKPVLPGHPPLVTVHPVWIEGDIRGAVSGLAPLLPLLLAGQP
eukprot:60983-Prorocentrum_minimum.AAC.3